ncbi:hypothetical protein K443DRAFT_674992 [Laccaria amethystina LaAM-08-1]|uniref:Uncharacterized protein n=1 Tax=Laccaria amethystina LaAM-08-1 TaxID=1095629 RepID=A0A0C9X0U7_9AGAR|nr:hypothetical protein K443DRAFT_674992 [Laccaria amethystina LaAM-08-1]
MEVSKHPVELVEYSQQPYSSPESSTATLLPTGSWCWPNTNTIHKMASFYSRTFFVHHRGPRTVRLDGNGLLLDGWWTGKFQTSTVPSVIPLGSRRGRYGDGDGRRTGDGC